MFESARRAVDEAWSRVGRVREVVQSHPATNRVRRSMLGQVIQNYLDDDVDGLAAMLAYNALFSLIPVLAAVSIIAGTIVESFNLRDDVSGIVTDEIPANIYDSVSQTADATIENQESFGVIALLLLLYGGSRLYSAMDRAFAVVYRSRRRGYVRRKIFALIVTPALAIALVISTIVSAGATGFLASSLGKYVDFNPHIQDYIAAYMIGFLIGFMLALIAYVLIPAEDSEWRQSIPGAAAAGLLFVLLSQLYPIYISITGGYNSYGAGFGLVLLFMFWLYLAAQIIIIGAEISAVVSGTRARNQIET